MNSILLTVLIILGILCALVFLLRGRGPRI
jgi:hypothetical protein